MSNTSYNTQILYQPLFSAKDQCLQNSEWFINDNLSYHMDPILPTDWRQWQQNHNIIRPQNLCCLLIRYARILVCISILGAYSIVSIRFNIGYKGDRSCRVKALGMCNNSSTINKNSIWTCLLLKTFTPGSFRKWVS